LLRKTVFPTIYYCVLTGSLAYIWVNGFGANLGTYGLAAVALVIGLGAYMLGKKGARSAR
jgi:lactate permease